MSKLASAIVTVSFQSSVAANQAAHKALTGRVQGVGPGPFRKPGTACYTAIGQDRDLVLKSIAELLTVATQHVDVVDSVLISFSVDRPDA